MRNRAKCKSCGDLIESTHRHDCKWCKCAAIAIDGGQAYRKLTGFQNAIIIEDDGNEIDAMEYYKPLNIKEDERVTETPEPTKEELLNMLELMVKGFDNLPQHAMMLPINHYDYASGLLLILSLFKACCKPDK